MKVVLFTIVLDGMPYITWHLPMLNKLKLDWHWHIMEGVADNKHCTKWCKKIDERLSLDGTSEYLDQISAHPRVTVHKKPMWDGKLEMVNVPMASISEKTLLIQVDSDEIWTSGQIETISQIFSMNPTKNAALFTCRYFVGQDIAVIERGGYGNRHGEWLRAFIVDPGMRFVCHEPPRFANHRIDLIIPEQTEMAGLIFDHYAYATEQQVAFKEKYYGYQGAVDMWRRLQSNTKWPARLSDFFNWVKDGSIVSKV